MWFYVLSKSHKCENMPCNSYFPTAINMLSQYFHMSCACYKTYSSTTWLPYFISSPGIYHTILPTDGAVSQCHSARALREE